MQTITRRTLKEKIDDTTVVEVLDEEQYHEFHLPGAVNVPLDEEFDEHIATAVPDKDQPVVVYCQNRDCNASAKAARRMDELGYRNVYDYKDGKIDWKRAGLPIES